MNWNEQTVRKNIWLYKSINVLRSLDFSRGLFVVYLLGIGMSAGEVGILQLVLFWATFALEVPSGIIADRVSRRFAIGLGCICMALGMLSFMYFSSFWALVVTFGLIGAAFAFFSGADEALLYDGLKSAGDSWLAKHIKVLSHARSLSIIATALAMMSAGYLFSFDPRSIFLLTAICALLAGFFCMFIDEADNVVASATPVGIFTSLKEVRIFAKTTRGKRLLVFVGFLALLEAVHTPFFIYSQNLFLEAGIKEEHISPILGLSFALNAIGLLFAPSLVRYGLQRLTLATIFILSAAFFGLYLTTDPVLIVAIAIIINLFPMLLFCHTDDYINHHCDSSFRATFLSVSSFITCLVVGLGYLAIGFLIDQLGAKLALSYSFIILIPCLIFFAKVFKQESHTHDA